MPIRRWFTEDGVFDFFESEKAQPKGSIFDRPIAPTPVKSVLSTFDQFASLMDSLERNFDKFYFASHSIEEWKRRYCFPNAENIQSQLITLGIGDDDLDQVQRLTINMSEQSIRSWISREFLSNPSKQTRGGNARVKYVVGTVGCGKSTLNKYITTVYFDEFKSKKVIPCRIECFKLVRNYLSESKSIGDYTDKELKAKIVSYLKICLVRDIVHQVCSCVQKTEREDGKGEEHWIVKCTIPQSQDVVHPAFREYLRSVFVDLSEPSMKLEDATIQIAKIFRKIGGEEPQSRSRIARSVLSQHTPEIVIDIIIGFFLQQGYNFVLFFDGFDYIGASDFFLETPQSKVIEALSDWIYTDECRIPILEESHGVNPHITLTIRQNTRHLIASRHNQIYSNAQATTFYVLSPSMREFFQSVAKELSTRFMIAGRQGNEKELRRFLIRARYALKKGLKIQGITLSSLFNGNVRHQINYSKDVILEMAYDILRNRSAVARSPAELIAALGLEASNWTDRRRYRLVDRLLFSANQRFSNFAAIKPRPLRTDPTGKFLHSQIEPKHIEDRNAESGYVGNILNYHADYLNRGDEAFLLEKVRVAQIIIDAARETGKRFEGFSVSSAWLQARFMENNWPISPYFEASLALLVREGMLLIGLSTRETTFSISPLGRLVCEHLIKRNSLFGERLLWNYHSRMDGEQL